MKLIASGVTVGGDHQIAFVFAVFLVDEDDHAAGRQFGNQLGNGGNGHPAIVGGGPGLPGCGLSWPLVP
jgi:hypothetical protein